MSQPSGQCRQYTLHDIKSSTLCKTRQHTTLRTMSPILEDFCRKDTQQLRVAVCCRVLLQCVAEYCSVLQGTAVRWCVVFSRIDMQQLRIAACCSCCSVLQCVAVFPRIDARQLMESCWYRGLPKKAGKMEFQKKTHRKGLLQNWRTAAACCRVL